MRHARLPVRSLLPLLLTGLVLLQGSPAGAHAPGLQAQVDALVEAHGVSAGEPGVGVLVVDAKGVRLKQAYGLANLAKRTPITSATTFELASVSKHMTGAAVLLLMQRGKLKVTDDVRKHVPEIPAYDPQHPITIDHLSRHTSGLPDYFAWRGPAATKKTYYTNADAVAELAHRRESSPLVSVPGSEYAYSNTGYMVLGALVERISGQRFGAFLAKEFFEPLGMKTAWVHESPRVPTVATAIGYTHDDEAWQPTWSAPTAERHEDQLTVGDGGVWASLDDMLAWDKGLRTGKPLPVATLLGALAPGTTSDGDRIAYAMGWDVTYDDEGGVATMSHTGKWEGFETYIGHDVAREITVVVLSNRRGFDAEGFGESVGALLRE